LITSIDLGSGEITIDFSEDKMNSNKIAKVNFTSFIKAVPLESSGTNRQINN